MRINWYFIYFYFFYDGYLYSTIICAEQEYRCSETSYYKINNKNEDKSQSRQSRWLEDWWQVYPLPHCNHFEVFDYMLLNLHFPSVCHCSQGFQGCNVLKGVLIASDILNCLHRVKKLWWQTVEVISVRTLSGAKLHKADEWRLTQSPLGLGELTLLLSFRTQLLHISNKSADTMKDLSKFLMAWPFRRLYLCGFCPFHCDHPVAFP